MNTLHSVVTVVGRPVEQAVRKSCRRECHQSKEHKSLIREHSVLCLLLIPVSLLLVACSLGSRSSLFFLLLLLDDCL